MAVDWDAVYDATDARRVSLPTYAFQREPHWVTPPPVEVVSAPPAATAPIAAPAPAARDLADVVAEQVAAVLGYAKIGAVATDKTFQELGFDSLGAVELRDRLAAVAGVDLPSSLLFDYPTPDAVVGFLSGAAPAAVVQ